MAERAIDRRVLICAPTGRDAEVLSGVLAGAEIDVETFPSVAQVSSEIGAGAGAAIIGDECLEGSSNCSLLGALEVQPEWSDFPLILMTSQGRAQAHGWRLLQEIGGVAHTMVLERPFRRLTLVAAVRAALQSRERQYQIRDDLARRREIERSLRESEGRFRSMADNLPLIVWLQNVDGAQEFVNETFCSYFGVQREEMTADRWKALMHPEDGQSYANEFAAAVRERRDFHAEVRVRRADGEWRHLESWAHPRFDADRYIGHVGVSADVTERKRAEEALRESARRKDVFLAMLAHELRNPLVPIRTGLDLMKSQDAQSADMERIRETMERQTRQLIALVDDLLQVARITRGKLELRRSVFALREAIQDAVDASRPVIDAEQHELVVSLPAEPVPVDADPNRLTQIVSNLLSNAARYTPQGGRIELLAARRGGDVEIRVRDNGIGIREEQRETIFEMFSQLDDPAMDGSRGLGIGLSLVHSLLRLHGGSIDVHSHGENRGSEFVVKLPIVVEDQFDAATSAREPDAAVKTSPHRRVLVVDDNQAVADMLKMALEAAGHEVRAAGDGSQAVQTAAEFRPELILMDLGMPHVDGLEAARRIRQEPWGRQIRLVALSGWGRDADVRRSREAGFDHHLVKPVEPEELKRLLAELDS